MFTEYKLTLTFIEPVLGTIPKNQEVLDAYVKDLARAGNDEMIAPETPAEKDERSSTGFYCDPLGRPLLYDYQVKGWLKEVGNIVKDNATVKALRSHIENDCYIRPRSTVLADKPDGELERPLRAMTMQGPRVSLVRSDYIAAGRSYDFTLLVREGSKVSRKVLEMICAFGEFRGLGQWRSGGYGAVKAEIS